MAKKMHKRMSRAAFLALAVATILWSSPASWAGTHHRHHIRQPQAGMCAPYCSASGFSPHPYYPGYDTYGRDYYEDRDYYNDRDYYEDRDYDEGRPSYPYDLYDRTIPRLPRGTDRIIEGVLDLFLQAR